MKFIFDVENCGTFTWIPPLDIRQQFERQLPGKSGEKLIYQMILKPMFDVLGPAICGTIKEDTPRGYEAFVTALATNAHAALLRMSDERTSE